MNKTEEKKLAATLIRRPVESFSLLGYKTWGGYYFFKIKHENGSVFIYKFGMISYDRALNENENDFQF